MTRDLEEKPIDLSFVGMDGEGRVASRLGGCLLLAPLCRREEKACVEWGSLSGSHVHCPRLLRVSRVPFGSWGLLAGNLCQDIT